MKEYADAPEKEIKQKPEKSKKDSENEKAGTKAENNGKEEKNDRKKEVIENSEETEEDNEAEKEDKEAAEDNLEMRLLPFRERMKAKRAKLKKTLSSMSKKEQFSYILFYYKWTFLAITIAIVCVVSITLTIYKNTRPFALSYAVLNISNPMDLNRDFEAEYIDYYGFPKKYQINLDAQRHLDKETYLKVLNSGQDSADYTGFPALCFNGRFDVVVTDEKGAEYCSMQEIFNPLQSYFPADIYPLLEDRIYEAANNDDVVMPFAIDISDTAFAKSLNTGYEKVYLGFPGTTDENYQHAKLFLKFVLGLDIEVTVPED